MSEDCTIGIKISAICENCEEELKTFCVGQDRNDVLELKVYPCQKCLDRRGDREYQTGFDAGERYAS